MTTIHLFQIETFESGFQNIVKMQNQIITSRATMQTKLFELKDLYGTLVKQNNKKIFLFCLDSFFFQYKTLSVELDNIQRSITMINNRIYGDYYKLYHLILIELSPHDSEVQKMLTEFKKYTPYKDLDPFHEYQTEDISKLHQDILRILTHVYVNFLKKEQKIASYSEFTTTGMSIGNFMQTLSYENTLLREQLLLYVNYLTFFHKSQTGFLAKLYTRVQLFQREIEEDILCNHSQLQNTSSNDPTTITQHLQAVENDKQKELEDTLVILEARLEKTKVDENTSVSIDVDSDNDTVGGVSVSSLDNTVEINDNSPKLPDDGSENIQMVVNTEISDNEIGTSNDDKE
jgi:hypothetical protein